MPAGRPKIPIELQRRLLVEAGHRCAIPTCRQTPVEFEHIEEWAKVREHSFENMIVLCPTCHARKGDKPGQIDRNSLRQYKANLAIINGRYGDLEQRLILLYANVLRDHPDDIHTTFSLPLGSGIQVLFLIQDGLLRQSDPAQNEAYLWVEFTEAGRDFVERWATAQPLDKVRFFQD